MLEKALNQELPNNQLLSGRPTAAEMASKLASKVYETRYEYTYSFEFEFIKGNYSFYCDVKTTGHGQSLECSCPMTFFEDDEIETEPGILYELEFETKKLL